MKGGAVPNTFPGLCYGRVGYCNANSAGNADDWTGRVCYNTMQLRKCKVSTVYEV